ncbi:hypothetical protein AZ78_1415 [Lysobacter capsici AZ78]|uniref:Uncharacterized protein n=1 Tax=Lysobacter capsici AZ78 TaxID=1444315 RepID=A0A108U790_9GAMM|nr:hypothetical protein AZ78_1415 [Lysobacter capsici AZ78]
MLSFFRRKKNETAAEKSAERGFSTEELAAAFPSAQPPEAGAPEPPAAPISRQTRRARPNPRCRPKS